MLINLKYFLLLCISFSVAMGQFWKLNAPSEKELFIMDVRSTMSAGICYKQVEAKVTDPEVRMRTVSYCCPGYRRNRLVKHALKCDPICNNDCENGICVAPDYCECYPGFKRENARCISFMHNCNFIFIIIFGICLAAVAFGDRLYSDYIDDIDQDEISIKPSDDEWKHPNFHPPMKKKPTKKPKTFAVTTEGMCVRNYHKRKAAEERENPQKEYKPSGNRWHGSVIYGSERFKHKQHSGRSPKVRDISPVERNLHKCYKWIRSEDIKRYEWPAVIQKNPADNTVLIEICCPHFGPVRVMGNTLCKPYCQSCQNGKCIAPEVCQCHDGYVLSDNNDCVFACPISCLNGRCNLLTRNCLCNSGYKLDETGQFCRPICRAGCGINPLHNCTAPDVCGCVKGFSLTDNDCQPIFSRPTYRRH
ncbi:uncharacterized protein [Musca autumnalis]|uniref:uncharacterized protein n=1 Tax=Musca autumnalis TaxID=221902 RepID=UPI003CF79FCC